MASQNPNSTGQAFELGDCRIDPQRRIIFGPSGKTIIEPKIMAVLIMLADRPGEVITRKEFIETIWAEEFSGDESLTRAISRLRKVLGDANGAHRHIETITKTGYRLTDKVRPARGTPKAGEWRKVLAAVLVIALAAGLTLIFMGDRKGGPVAPPAIPGQAAVILAVLPFESQSELSEDVSLAYGLTDEILSALSRSPSISVIAGSSSFRFQGEGEKLLETLARDFNISHVVDGSVRRSPEGLRVGVYLVDAGSGIVLWSDVVTRPESEIYTIPNEVASAVQSALGTNPVKPESRQSPPDPAAYEAYLQAKALLRLPWGLNLLAAITYLESVVEMDPEFGAAWATLALARLDILFSQPTSDPELSSIDPPGRLRTARRDAVTALAADPGSVDALLALNIIDYRLGETSLIETISELETLLAKAPSHPRVVMRLGLMVNSVGHFSEAIRYLGKSVDLDPMGNLPGAFYTDALISGGLTGQALAFMEQRGVYEYYKITYAGLTMALLNGNYQDARSNFTGLGSNVLFGPHQLIQVELSGIDSPVTARLSELVSRLITVAEQGGSSLDPDIANDLLAVADEGLIPHFYVCQWLAAAGLKDAALELARTRITQGDTLFRESGILLKPAFRTARRNPEIFELFAETGQLDYWLETDNWPDYCAEPELPYVCEQIAARLSQNQR